MVKEEVTGEYKMRENERWKRMVKEEGILKKTKIFTSSGVLWVQTNAVQTYRTLFLIQGDILKSPKIANIWVLYWV